MAKKRIYRFKGTEGGKIAEADARKWIQNHRDHHEVRAHFYGKKVFEDILKQPGCVGIRIHHAINDKGQKALVLIGADEKGNHIFPAAKGKSKGKTTIADGPSAYDMGFPCPPYCGSDTP